jgi:iron complex outermembrane receptor protein
MTKTVQVLKMTFLLLAVAFTAVAQAQTQVSGIVTGKNNQPLAGASVVEKTGGKGTSTNANGQFSITVANNQSVIEISAIGYATQLVSAGAAGSIQLVEEANSLDPVVVVGSRATRTALKTAVPVDAISFKTITQSLPQVDVNQILTYLAPSFQSNRQSASDGTEHVDPASLRGLGPDQLLVLVNGKRRHNSSLLNYQGTAGNGSVGTDLNAIPAAAIERIEVLRDGAAAQYGSDAIAGVINIVLKKNVDGLLINTGLGITGQGDGLNGGFNFNQGISIGKHGGYLNLTGDLLFRNKTNRSQNHDLIIFDQSSLGNFFAYDFTGDPAASRAYDDNILAQKGLKRDDFNFRIGDAGIENGAAWANLNLPFGKKYQHEFYAFGGLSYRSGSGNGFRRLPSETSNVNSNLFPNGFQPGTLSKIIDGSLSFGARFALASEWKLDLSNTFGSNSFGYTVNNTNNASLLDQSPTRFEAGSHRFIQNTVNADLRRFFPTVAQGLNLAFGAEFRVDGYQIKAGEEASWRNYAYSADGQTIINPSLLDFAGGSQSFVGFSPRNATSQSRTNIAGFIDAELDVTKAFLVTAAVRAENYSDFGGTINGKLAARYQISKAIGIRAAVSTGFRAPSLQQQYFSYTSTDILPNGQLGQSGFFPVESSVAKSLGIQALKEETSLNISGGITLNPSKNFKLTIDGYVIDIDNRIVLSGAFGFDPYGDDDVAIQTILEPYGVKSARFFSNAVDTRTKGIDVVAEYHWAINKAHQLNISLAANINENKVKDGLHIPSQLAGKEDIYFSPVEKSIIETYAPNKKATLGFTHSYKKWNTQLRFTYFGEVTRNGYPFGSLQKHSAKVVTDLSVSYKITDKFRFSAGANNLFNVFPDEQVYENSYFGVFKYAPVQMGVNGSIFFGRLSIQL